MQRYALKVVSEIHESKQIKDFLAHLNEGDEHSFVVLDLDNTVMESIQELGSDQWFVKLMAYAIEISPSKETEALVLAIYNAVQQRTKMKAVEDDVVSIIKKLQNRGTPVLALTARGPEIMQATFNQLDLIGINFYNKRWGQDSFKLKIDDKEDRVIFNQGILFCSGSNKGICLDAFFKAINYHPQNIIMVDDKEKHLESVKKIAKGNFVGLRYGYLDEKVSQFKKEKAEAQMAEISHLFPDGAKEALERLERLRLSAIKSKIDSPLSSQSIFKPQEISTSLEEASKAPGAYASLSK